MQFSTIFLLSMVFISNVIAMENKKLEVSVSDKEMLYESDMELNENPKSLIPDYKQIKNSLSAIEPHVWFIILPYLDINATLELLLSSTKLRENIMKFVYHYSSKNPKSMLKFFGSLSLFMQRYLKHVYGDNISVLLSSVKANWNLPEDILMLDLIKNLSVKLEWGFTPDLVYEPINFLMILYQHPKTINIDILSEELTTCNFPETFDSNVILMSLGGFDQRDSKTDLPYGNWYSVQTQQIILFTSSIYDTYSIDTVNAEFKIAPFFRFVFENIDVIFDITDITFTKIYSDGDFTDLVLFFSKDFKKMNRIIKVTIEFFYQTKAEIELEIIMEINESPYRCMIGGARFQKNIKVSSENIFTKVDVPEKVESDLSDVHQQFF